MGSFVHPLHLVFSECNKEARKQVLLVSNPCEVSTRYEVFTTSPESFKFSRTSGTLGPGKQVNLFVEYRPFKLQPEAKDYIKISLRDCVSRSEVSKCVIKVRWIAESRMGFTGGESSVGEHEFFIPVLEGESIRHTDSLNEDRLNDFQESQVGSNVGSLADELPRRNPNYVDAIMYAICIICCVGIFWPVEGLTASKRSIIPAYLHISYATQLVMAYVLGIATRTIFFR